MFCNKCGNQIPDNSATCPNCGAPTGAGSGTQVPFNGGEAPKVPFFQQQSESINFIALIIAVVGLICVFPAKVTAEFLGFEASEGILSHYGWLMAALFVAVGILLFLKKSNAAVVPAAINAVFCIFKMIQELSSGEEGINVGLNAFYWIVIIAAIVEVVAILVLPKMMGKQKTNTMM